jgi:hypothetical protein
MINTGQKMFVDPVLPSWTPRAPGMTRFHALR